MKRIIILAVLSASISCTKTNEPLKEKGTLTLSHTSNSRMYYYEIDGGERIAIKNVGPNVDCSTSLATRIKLTPGTHTITISNSGGCANASGFTQTFTIGEGQCFVTKLDCYTSEL